MGKEGLVVDIVLAVANATGLDPSEMNPPFADVIDPDALERCVHNQASNAHVTFTYQGQVVDVQPDGTFTVTDSSDRY